jgi:hypothetical protein
MDNLYAINLAWPGLNSVRDSMNQMPAAFYRSSMKALPISAMVCRVSSAPRRHKESGYGWSASFANFGSSLLSRS